MDPESTASQSKSELDHLLEVRRQIKAKTPHFQRQESWRYVRIHEPWRKPKGVDSHMRLSVKGWPHLVKVGYRVPKKVRGLHPSGYRDVLVHNVEELEALSPETDAARFGATVGRRKRIEMAQRARELKIRVLNARGLLIAEKPEEKEEEAAPAEEVEETKAPVEEAGVEGEKEEAVEAFPEESEAEIPAAAHPEEIEEVKPEPEESAVQAKEEPAEEKEEAKEPAEEEKPAPKKSVKPKSKPKKKKATIKKTASKKKKAKKKKSTSD